MDQPYTNRELDDHFREIKEQLDRVESQGKRIETEVRFTNGRVSNLEGWKTGIAMGISVIIFAVIPLLAYIWTTQVSSINEQLLMKQNAFSSAAIK